MDKKSNRNPFKKKELGPICKKTREEKDVKYTIPPLQFEKFLSQTATQLSAQPEETLDSEIVTQLKATAELFKIDRCGISFFYEGRKKLKTFYHYSTNKAEHGRNPCSFVEAPWYVEKVNQGEVIALGQLPHALPKHAKMELKICQDAGIKSNLGLPLRQDQHIIGAMTFDCFQSSRPWPASVIKQLNRLGNLFAGLTNRKKTGATFKKRLQFEQMLSEVSSVFANLPAEEVDEHIEYGLERIGKFLAVDRSNYVHGFQANKISGTIYSWANEGIVPLPALKNIDQEWPWVQSLLIKGKHYQFTHVENLPPEAAIDKKNFLRVGAKSQIQVPIAIGGPVIGSIALTSIKKHCIWPKEIIPRLRLVGEVFANALVRKKKEIDVATAFNEIQVLKNQIEADCSYLKEEIELKYNHYNMIGKSQSFKSMIYKINQIAHMNTTVLIYGETGTGKEMVARAIHANSKRKNRPMVKVNCASLSPTLIESELFGHEKGAFTGSQGRRIGRFELANGNTLFLDEIGELPFESQSKLLRVLQEGEFERLGSSRTLKVDVRVIAATNRNLEEEVKKGRFRMDLFYRLNIFPINIPPLRNRKSDIPLLTEWFTRKFSEKTGKPIKKIPLNVIKALQHFQWPGNVRELENVIERAVINTQGTSLQLTGQLSNASEIDAQAEKKYTLEEVEKNYIVQILEETHWRVEGPNGAALVLGLHPSTLRGRMRKLGIRV